MARFDVYANPEGPGYLLDVQSDLLEALNSCIVVPLLRPEAAPLPARRLNPAFQIEAVTHVMVTQFMAAVPRGMLRQPVTSLAAESAAVMAALDMVFLGF